jgi:hypothetical protein
VEETERVQRVSSGGSLRTYGAVAFAAGGRMARSAATRASAARGRPALTARTGALLGRADRMSMIARVLARSRARKDPGQARRAPRGGVREL